MRVTTDGSYLFTDDVRIYYFFDTCQLFEAPKKKFHKAVDEKY